MNKEKTEKMATKNNIPGGWINARNKKRVIRKESSMDNRERNLIYIYNCLQNYCKNVFNNRNCSSILRSDAGN